METEDSDEIPSSSETIDFSEQEEEQTDKALKNRGSDYEYVYCEIIYKKNIWLREQPNKS